MDNTLSLIGLCYHATEQAPVKRDAKGNLLKDENGNYIPLDESVVADSEGQVTVGVCYAPINGCFTHSVGDDACERNKLLTDNLRGWSALTEELFCYTYGSNFSSFTTHTNNWSFMTSLYKLFEECDVMYHFDECNSSNDISSMSSMRVFIRNSLAWNPRQNFEDLVEEFCEMYYGPASQSVQDYFYEMLHHFNYIDTISGNYCYGWNQDIGGTRYWQHQTIINFTNRLQKAMNDIETSNLTAEQKEVYTERVYREYFLVKYNEHRYYLNYLSAEDAAKLDELVKAGIEKYGISAS